ncbi:unnamed protein product, partial [Discosporangium mesarthrocarpum]
PGSGSGSSSGSGLRVLSKVEVEGGRASRLRLVPCHQRILPFEGRSCRPATVALGKRHPAAEQPNFRGFRVVRVSCRSPWKMVSCSLKRRTAATIFSCRRLIFGRVLTTEPCFP